MMPKELKHESEIKAVLDHQLINLRTYHTNPRAPSQDLSGLRSTYYYEKDGNNGKSDHMLKTGQVPMEVNAMPGQIRCRRDGRGWRDTRRWMLFLQETRTHQEGLQSLQRREKEES